MSAKGCDLSQNETTHILSWCHLLDSLSTPEGRVWPHDSSECDQSAEETVSSQARCGGHRSRENVPTATGVEMLGGCWLGIKERLLTWADLNAPWRLRLQGEKQTSWLDNGGGVGVGYKLTLISIRFSWGVFTSQWCHQKVTVISRRVIRMSGGQRGSQLQAQTINADILESSHSITQLVVITVFWMQFNLVEREKKMESNPLCRNNHKTQTGQQCKCTRDVYKYSLFIQIWAKI